MDSCGFSKYLHTYKSLVLHEVLYYDGLDQLRQHINATPRATMQSALTQPFCYLPVSSSFDFYAKCLIGVYLLFFYTFVKHQ